MYLSRSIFDEISDCGWQELQLLDRRSRPAALRVAEGALRRKLRIGTCVAEIREFLAERKATLRPAPNTVTVMTILSGSVEIAAGNFQGRAARGSTLILAGGEALSAKWGAGSRASTLAIPRSRVQAAASHRFGGPRRLAAMNTLLEAGELDAEMTQIIAWFVDRIMGSDDPNRSFGSTPEASFVDCLVKTIGKVEAPDAAFPVARSVQRAMAFAEQRHGIGCTPETLARAAGVIPATLRQNFRACLGISIMAFIQGVRLDFIRHLLLGGMDSRPMREIARAAGFDNLSVFSRSYQIRFGETPSQTRAESRNQAVS